eukprot:1714505-Prymnesium_polylepis.1
MAARRRRARAEKAQHGRSEGGSMREGSTRVGHTRVGVGVDMGVGVGVVVGVGLGWEERARGRDGERGGRPRRRVSRATWAGARALSIQAPTAREELIGSTADATPLW